jgi:hypothetical protein
MLHRLVNISERRPKVLLDYFDMEQTINSRASAISFRTADLPRGTRPLRIVGHAPERP